MHKLNERQRNKTEKSELLKRKLGVHSIDRRSVVCLCLCLLLLAITKVMLVYLFDTILFLLYTLTLTSFIFIYCRCSVCALFFCLFLVLSLLFDIHSNNWNRFKANKKRAAIWTVLSHSRYWWMLLNAFWVFFGCSLSCFRSVLLLLLLIGWCVLYCFRKLYYIQFILFHLFFDLFVHDVFEWFLLCFILF